MAINIQYTNIYTYKRDPKENLPTFLRSVFRTVNSITRQLTCDLRIVQECVVDFEIIKCFVINFGFKLS